jgi:NAD(P)-dependent dehydrogenase (short-subunit alcohol dehydrogenase family)
MANRLEGKVCLITGSSGIAAASARLSAAEGARVFILGREAEECEQLHQELSRQGSQCGFHVADLSIASQAEAAVAHCRQAFPNIHVLFNVAGLSGRRFGDGPLHECTDEGWEKTLANNLDNTFHVSRAVLRWMLEQQRGGSIVHMASVTAFSPESEMFATHAYAVAKAAIIGLTKSMASYYARFGIRVNALAPGLVRTPMSRRAQGDEHVLEFVRAKQPLTQGMVSAEQVASAAVFLMSDDASAVTGEIITVDGGWSVTG